MGSARQIWFLSTFGQGKSNQAIPAGLCSMWFWWHCLLWLLHGRPKLTMSAVYMHKNMLLYWGPGKMEQLCYMWLRFGEWGLLITLCLWPRLQLFYLYPFICIVHPGLCDANLIQSWKCYSVPTQGAFQQVARKVGWILPHVRKKEIFTYYDSCCARHYTRAAVISRADFSPPISVAVHKNIRWDMVTLALCKG